MMMSSIVWLHVGINRLPDRWAPQPVTTTESHVAVHFDDVRQTPTHATRFRLLDVLKVLFAGDQHGRQDDQQLVFGFPSHGRT